MHPDRIVNKRSIYNVLDFMGDIGGLKEALSQLCALFLFILGKDHSFNGFLVNSIFKKPSKQEKQYMHQQQ